MTRPPQPGPDHLVVGRYRLLSRIAGGGMGTVWLARDERLGREVAVKQVLPPQNADAKEAQLQRDRALREGRLAARLTNPHVISVYDVAVEHDQPWLVMEYLPSRSLAEVLAEDGLLRVDQVAQIGAQLADALAATHAAGIVHRDVKPANVLIGRGERVEGLVKITDFGISHAAGDVTLTQTGQITGTPAFLSPEVAQGEEPQPPSDVFALGATLYTCLEGVPPFGMGDNALQLLHRVASGEVLPPSNAGALTRPLMRMLATDPAERPTMPEVRDELARLVAGPGGDTTPVLLTRPDLRPARGRPATARFPVAQDSPVADAPAPAPAPPPPPASMPAAAGPLADRPDPGARRRRRRAPVPLLIGALVVLAAAVLAVLLIPRGNGGNATGAQGPSTSHTSGTTRSGTTTGSAPSGASSSAPGTPSPSASASGTGSAAGAPTAADVRSFISRYFGLLPGNADQAYDLTGPTLRGVESRQDYIAFWRRFSQVQLGPVTATDGSLVAQGTVTYVENGRSQTEQHTFTLVRGDGGQLLMDSDRQG